MASIDQADENPKREKTILETVQMIWYPFVISLSTLEIGERKSFFPHSWENCNV